MSPASRQTGFSLLEVIAAIVLLAITFAALMKVAGGAMALSQNAAAYNEVTLHARSLLDGAFVAEPLTLGRRNGRFDKRYRWTLDVVPWQAPGTSTADPTLPLYRLDLTVQWGSRAHPRTAHFDTLRLAVPKPSAGGDQ